MHSTSFAPTTAAAPLLPMGRAHPLPGVLRTAQADHRRRAAMARLLRFFERRQRRGLRAMRAAEPAVCTRRVSLLRAQAADLAEVEALHVDIDRGLSRELDRRLGLLTADQHLPDIPQPAPALGRREPLLLQAVDDRAGIWLCVLVALALEGLAAWAAGPIGLLAVLTIGALVLYEIARNAPTAMGADAD